MAAERVSFSVRLLPNDHRYLKIAAAISGISVNEYLETLIQKHATLAVDGYCGSRNRVPVFDDRAEAAAAVQEEREERGDAD